MYTISAITQIHPLSKMLYMCSCGERKRFYTDPSGSVLVRIIVSTA